VTKHRSVGPICQLGDRFVEPWAFALGEPRAYELASAIDRHFHITEAPIREE
jgi:hypothetical protein